MFIPAYYSTMFFLLLVTLSPDVCKHFAFSFPSILRSSHEAKDYVQVSLRAYSSLHCLTSKALVHHLRSL